MLENTYRSINEKLEPDQSLIAETLQKMELLCEGRKPERRSAAVRRPKSIKRAVIIAVAVLLTLCLTVGAAATVSMMTAKDVSRYMDGNIEVAYSGENAVALEEEAVLNEYIVTLSGMAHDENHTYISLSYRRKDGSPCNPEEVPFLDIGVELLVSDLPPYVLNRNTMEIRGDGVAPEDGALYQTLCFPNMEAFADRTIYLAVYDSVFSADEYPVKSQADPSNSKFRISVNEAVKMNEDGSMEFLEGYPNAHAMFVLPFDQSKADPEKAQEYLDSLEAYQHWKARTGPFAGTTEDGYSYHDFQEVQDSWKNNLYLG